jgi:hypothetical protein
MTAGGLSDGFTRDGLIEIGKRFDIQRPQEIIGQTVDAFSTWPDLAKEWAIPAAQIAHVAGMHRLLRTSSSPR